MGLRLIDILDIKSWEKLTEKEYKLVSVINPDKYYELTSTTDLLGVSMWNVRYSSDTTELFLAVAKDIDVALNAAYLNEQWALASLKNRIKDPDNWRLVASTDHMALHFDIAKNMSLEFLVSERKKTEDLTYTRERYYGYLFFSKHDTDSMVISRHMYTNGSTRPKQFLEVIDYFGEQVLETIMLN